MALATAMLAGCTMSAGAPGASFEAGASELTRTETSPAPQPTPDMPTCPPDTAVYDEETHEPPPADAPVADCYVPEVSGPPGPPKQAVPLPSAAT
jgi:hypothetical protein